MTSTIVYFVLSWEPLSASITNAAFRDKRHWGIYNICLTYCSHSVMGVSKCAQCLKTPLWQNI